MKAFASKEKQSVTAGRKAHPYVHHPMGPVQLAQRAKIRHILHSTGTQAKLTVGAPNDKYEQEADRVADQVMRMPDPKLQRQPENEAEEETLQAKPLAAQITPLIQRQAEPDEEEEESVQPGYDQEPKESSPIMESVPTRDAGELGGEEDELIQTKPLADKPGSVTAELHSKIQSLKGGGQTLPASERAFFEPRFGRCFGNVRVHSDDNRAGLIARSINARAFTHGRDVVFGSAQYAPGTSEGRRLMAHELTHVVQQDGGGHVRRETVLTPLLALLAPFGSIRSRPVVNHYYSSTQYMINMKPDNRSLTVPQWNQLPELAKRELAAKRYTKSWFSNKSAVRRLSVLNIYVKLRGLNLWKYVASESSSGHGTLEFMTSNVAELNKTLDKRGDFSNPEKSFSKWSSREKRASGSLHFKHFSGWPKNKVQAHIDKAGLSGGIPIPIIRPLIQAIRHLIDWASDGYQDVYGIRDILFGQGWWKQPLKVQPKTRRLSKSSRD